MAGHFSSLLDQPAPGQSRIAVTVLTGFLGSGKTTLLNRVIREPDLAGTAVIVNEFGAVGIDHDLIEQATEDTVLLPNGCLCCAVRGDLVQALSGLARRPGGAPRRVLIETSGLADPAPILRTLMADPALRARYALAAVACTVDAVLGEATLRTHPEAARQLAVADHVFVTKTDLAAPARPLLDRLGATAAAVHTDRQAFAAILLELMGGAAQPAATAPDELAPWLRPVAADMKQPAAVHSQGVATVVITRDEPVPRAGLAAWLDMLVAARGDELLRIKGLVCIAEHPDRPLVVHGVQHLFHPPEILARWPGRDHRTRIVLIGRGLDAQALDETFGVFARRRRHGAGGNPAHHSTETP